MAHPVITPTIYPALRPLGRRGWLKATLALGTGWLLAPTPAAAAAPALLLARDARPDIDPAGWLVSEKLDGVRALWDGERLVSRGGQVLAAPAAWRRGLPTQRLDGELWLGRGRFDELSGRVRRAAGDDWLGVSFMAFELPGAGGSFAQRAERLARLSAEQPSPHWAALPQRTLADRESLRAMLGEVLRAGGEGLMLHRADAPEAIGRSDHLLKLKPVFDAEGVVVAHAPGRGRHAGRMGALRLRLADGTEFELGTGFTDAQRDAPPPLGSVVSFTHRGFTPRGVPRFASFLRLRADLVGASVKVPS
jgi:DNA ligase-1